jgi:hypothetical protein
VCLSNRPGLSLDQQPNQVSGVLVDESEPSMNDNSASESGMTDDALKLAKSAVDLASAHADEIGRHFFDAVEKARRPETYVELAKSATVRAPLAMLAAAFIAGALFGSGHRRR